MHMTKIYKERTLRGGGRSGKTWQTSQMGVSQRNWEKKTICRKEGKPVKTNQLSHNDRYHGEQRNLVFSVAAGSTAQTWEPCTGSACGPKLQLQWLNVQMKSFPVPGCRNVCEQARMQLRCWAMQICRKEGKPVKDQPTVLQWSFPRWTKKFGLRCCRQRCADLRAVHRQSMLTKTAIAVALPQIQTLTPQMNATESAAIDEEIDALIAKGVMGCNGVAPNTDINSQNECDWESCHWWGDW